MRNGESRTRFIIHHASFIISAISFLALLAATIAWSRRKAPSPADFTFIIRGDITTLDTRGITWLQDMRIAYALYEGLYTLDPRTLKPVLGCADRVDITPDKTVYTFHIRDGARWCNGDDVTAGDFIFAWRRALEQPGDYTYLFNCIAGAEAYKTACGQGKPADFSTVGVKAIARKTLRVHLKQPVKFFPDLCAYVSYLPLHEPSMRKFRIVDAKTGRVSYDARFTRPPNLVGNGPYRLESWEFKQRLRLVASDYYWNRAAVKSKVIDALCYSDVRTAFLRYEMGGIDWISDINSMDAADLLARGRKDIHIFPGFGTYFYSINCQPKLKDGRPNPLADVRVRQSLCMALNKRPIIDNVTRLHQPIADTFLPPSVFAGYQSPQGLPHDPQRARQLLADAGYPGGRGFPKLSILYNEGDEHGLIAQICRKQWLDVLGIDIELEALEIKSFRQRLHGRDYTIARASWMGDYDDPSNFLGKFISTSDNNDAGWANARYDRLCRDGETETDPTRRNAMFTQAEQILVDDVPIIPLYFYVNCYLYPDRVRGLPPDPRSMVMLHAVEVHRP